MHRHAVVHSDERKRNLSLGYARKVNLGFFGSLLDTLHSHLIFYEVNARGSLVFLDNPVHNALIEVVAAQTVVTSGCKNLEHSVSELEYGHVERTAAEVEYKHLLSFVVVLVDAVSKRSRGRLVDYTLNLETCDFTRVLGRLTL